MEVVHAHIAKVPARPDEVKEGISEVVSETVDQSEYPTSGA